MIQKTIDRYISEIAALLKQSRETVSSLFMSTNISSGNSILSRHAIELTNDDLFIISTFVRSWATSNYDANAFDAALIRDNYIDENNNALTRSLVLFSQYIHGTRYTIDTYVIDEQTEFGLVTNSSNFIPSSDIKQYCLNFKDFGVAYWLLNIRTYGQLAGVISPNLIEYKLPDLSINKSTENNTTTIKYIDKINKSLLQTFGYYNDDTRHSFAGNRISIGSPRTEMGIYTISSGLYNSAFNYNSTAISRYASAFNTSVSAYQNASTFGLGTTTSDYIAQFVMSSVITENDRATVNMSVNIPSNVQYQEGDSVILYSMLTDAGESIDYTLDGEVQYVNAISETVTQLVIKLKSTFFANIVSGHINKKLVVDSINSKFYIGSYNSASDNAIFQIGNGLAGLPSNILELTLSNGDIELKFSDYFYSNESETKYWTPTSEFITSNIGNTISVDDNSIRMTDQQSIMSYGDGTGKYISASLTGANIVYLDSKYTYVKSSDTSTVEAPDAVFSQTPFIRSIVQSFKASSNSGKANYVQFAADKDFNISGEDDLDVTVDAELSITAYGALIECDALTISSPVQLEFSNSTLRFGNVDNIELQYSGVLTTYANIRQIFAINPYYGNSWAAVENPLATSTGSNSTAVTGFYYTSASSKAFIGSQQDEFSIYTNINDAEDKIRIGGKAFNIYYNGSWGGSSGVSSATYNTKLVYSEDFETVGQSVELSSRLIHFKQGVISGKLDSSYAGSYTQFIGFPGFDTFGANVLYKETKVLRRDDRRLARQIVTLDVANPDTNLSGYAYNAIENLQLDSSGRVMCDVVETTPLTNSAGGPVYLTPMVGLYVQSINLSKINKMVTYEIVVGFDGMNDVFTKRVSGSDTDGMYIKKINNNILARDVGYVVSSLRTAQIFRRSPDKHPSMASLITVRSLDPLTTMGNGIFRYLPLYVMFGVSHVQGIGCDHGNGTHAVMWSSTDGNSVNYPIDPSTDRHVLTVKPIYDSVNINSSHVSSTAVAFQINMSSYSPISSGFDVKESAGIRTLVFRGSYEATDTLPIQVLES